MAGALKKPPMFAPVAQRRMLDKISKAALIDLYMLALARANGAADDIPTPEAIRHDANPVLTARGDRKI